MSPDGFNVVYVKSQVDTETMKVNSQIILRKLPDGEEILFTNGPKDGTPKISPDGKSIAFTRPDEAGQSQIWLLSMIGGEGCRLTSVQGGVTDIAWSPDSSRLAFVSKVDPDLPTEHMDSDIPRVKVISRLYYRADGEGWRGDSFKHIFIADTKTGELMQLTDGDGDNLLPVWSPDGSNIAFVSDRGEFREIKDRSATYVVSALGGVPKLWSEGLTNTDVVSWSPDGHSLAVIGTNDEALGANGQGW